MSFVVPVFHDADGLADLVRSIEQQDYPGQKALIIAVAADSTLSAQMAADFRSAAVPVEFIANDANTLAAGLNESIAYSKGAVVIRLSAGSVLPPDYASQAVSAITSTGAAVVGGRIRYRGVNDFEKAVARAYALKVGKAGDPFLDEPDGPTTGDAQAVFRRNVLIEAGLYDEDLRAGQDWELNYRLRESGHLVWRSGSLVRVDRPPRRLAALTRGQFADGLWRGQVKRQFPEIPGLTHRLPLAVVSVVLGTFILGAAGLFGTVAGAVGLAAVLSAAFSYLLLLPLFYVVSTLALGVIVAIREGWRVGAWIAVVLPAIHFSWGGGFVLGYLRVDPPIREVDEA